MSIFDSFEVKILGNLPASWTFVSISDDLSCFISAGLVASCGFFDSFGLPTLPGAGSQWPRAPGPRSRAGGAPRRPAAPLAPGARRSAAGVVPGEAAAAAEETEDEGSECGGYDLGVFSVMAG